jgi:hypothetical protein
LPLERIAHLIAAKRLGGWNIKMDRPFCTGRLQPTEAAIGPLMRLARYATPTLPDPPDQCDYSQAAAASLSKIYLNNRLGDCVLAGIFHLIGIFTGNADGQPLIATDDQIIEAYSRIGGYDPNAQLVPGPDGQMINPTDRGCDEVTALNAWRDDGVPVGQNRIYGWIPIDATDPRSVKLAMWLFENLFGGVCLPPGWVNPMPQQSDFRWDLAGQPNPREGHCIVFCGFTSDGLIVSTWGLIGLVTWAAIAAYLTQQAGGALYVVISDESISKASGKSGSGFDFRSLVGDFNALGGQLNVPEGKLDFSGIH